MAFIRIRGAREHNLKGIDLDLPRDKLIVVTGLSGSGKSSLAFDTLYAEGQRRYVESLSSYARQFLEQIHKPDVDFIEGLPPTVAIESRPAPTNPRSTVATTTEVYDYLRVLLARAGTPHCPNCGRVIGRQSPEQIVEEVLSFGEDTRIMILAPLARNERGKHRDLFRSVQREGFVRVRVDGEIVEADPPPTLQENRAHTIELVVDRLIVRRGVRSRLHESIETALRLGEGSAIVAREVGGPWVDHRFSELYACPECDERYEEIEPRTFSFNSPYGACPECGGLGVRMEFDPALLIPHPERSLEEGAVELWQSSEHRLTSYYERLLEEFAEDFDMDPSMPFAKLPKEKQNILLRGTSPSQARKYGCQFEGVIPELTRRFRSTNSDTVKKRLMQYMSELPCSACGGGRLRPEALAVQLSGRTIHEVTRLSVAAALEFFRCVDLCGAKKQIAGPLVQQLVSRLEFLADVGLSYLTLDRVSGTLAGGELQRIRLATQVGSRLVGVCYVLDEPTTGLHAKDTEKLIHTLMRLRDMGNTVIVVEHDPATIRAADYVVDLGPGAGGNGGRVVACGTLEDVLRSEDSLTAQFLSGKRRIDVPPRRRQPDGRLAIEIRGAEENNLKDIDVRFPLRLFTCVTGVSGSGKSTLVSDILHKALLREVYGTRTKPGRFRSLKGAEYVDKVIDIDQSPIGRTPRSNAATYTGVFAHIRRVFASTREGRMRGYQPNRFSFNVKGGRCEACEGQGTKRIEMHFLPDLFVTCEQCKGKRYNRETLEVRYRGKNIADVLDMRVEEARDFFKNYPMIRGHLETLCDVGLDYLALGQSSTTLSGGEAQRIKLAAELGKRQTGRTFYILDEPTTGLHFADIHKLLAVLNRLVDLGNTVVVIEHNLDVIKTADYIIDLGPEGGDNGGQVVATGTPEDIAENPNSATGQYLRTLLGG